MNAKFIESIKNKLIAEKAKIEAELQRFAQKNTKVTGTDYNTEFVDLGSSEDDNAAEVALYSDNLALEDVLEKALRDIEGTLKIIEAGEYGVCKYCGQKIDERRLEARPTSTSCIQCKKTLTQEV